MAVEGAQTQLTSLSSYTDVDMINFYGVPSSDGNPDRSTCDSAAPSRGLAQQSRPMRKSPNQPQGYRERHGLAHRLALRQYSTAAASQQRPHPQKACQVAWPAQFERTGSAGIAPIPE